MADDPNFYHRSERQPFARPMTISGFAFNPAASTIDFSAVPGFDLARLQSIQHVKTGACLYGRPYARYFAFGLAEVDGVPVPPPPSVGKVLKSKTDCSGMLPNDELAVLYDLPPGG